MEQKHETEGTKRNQVIRIRKDIERNCQCEERLKIRKKIKQTKEVIK